MRARPGGPGRAASGAAALLTIAGASLVMLLGTAVLMPTGGRDQGTAAGASPAPTTRPEPTAIAAPASVPVPAATPSAPAMPDPTSAPAPSAPPATDPPPTEPVAAPRELALAEPLPIAADGRTVGRVTVQAIRQAPRDGTGVGGDRRVMVAVVRLDAAAGSLPYDERRWRLEDRDGDRWEPTVVSVRQPLGRGTLAAGDRRTGQVAFAIPADRKVLGVVLLDEDGTDVARFLRPIPTD